ncbi:hypothetical protein C8J56DRAFT_807203 [Mycena floridula]|nr:hypothetical protein C8J56DRAFT_807203 [Mycena floridula]
MDVKPYDQPSFFGTSPTDSYFDSSGFYSPDDSTYSPSFNDNLYLSNWVNDVEPMGPSSPIPIPQSPIDEPPSQFISYHETSHFPYSPATYAALHPLPGSLSPSSSLDDIHLAHSQRFDSISPQDTSLNTPDWATQLWDTPPQLSFSPPRSVTRPSPLAEGYQRPRRLSSRRGSNPSIQFQSASAPAFSPLSAGGASRSYSHRAEASDDRDATIRRKRKISVPDNLETPRNAAPLKPVVRPPKLAPSAWQLYFTDWIQRQQASSSTRKLNVAQAAKEAGLEYASLSAEDKEVFGNSMFSDVSSDSSFLAPISGRSQGMKEARERELSAYMRTLTPDDIKRENAYRTAQRKAGKSRKSNIKDPNAPKKPLSAYFMFLQRIRANPHMVQDIFGDETETTKQSVLAAAKWRAMTDDERKPYLAQAEQEKMEYENARRLYEDGSTGFGTSINFSILPGSPAFPTLKVESESESESLAMDFEHFHSRP